MEPKTDEPLPTPAVYLPDGFSLPRIVFSGGVVIDTLNDPALFRLYTL